MRKTVFLDRDGTIIIDKNYLKQTSEVEFIPGAIEAIKLLNQNDYLVLVITNQSGVARGFFDESKVDEIHQYINHELHRISGAHIDRFYYCPHHPDAALEPYRQDCECRKPKPGLFKAAQLEFAIDAGNSWMIGDKRIDAEFALNAGIKPILVATGYHEYGGQDQTIIYKKDILAAVHYILSER